MLSGPLSSSFPGFSTSMTNRGHRWLSGESDAGRLWPHRKDWRSYGTFGVSSTGGGSKTSVHEKGGACHLEYSFFKFELLGKCSATEN